MPISAIKRDAVKFLKQCTQPFTLIFADPPYDISAEMLQELVLLCRDGHLLREQGQLVIEHSPHRDLSALSGFQQVRKYGNTHFSFFSWD
jgi:16S rRNA G966 N2-methylase RsmD